MASPFVALQLLSATIHNWLAKIQYFQNRGVVELRPQEGGPQTLWPEIRSHDL